MLQTSSGLIKNLRVHWLLYYSLLCNYSVQFSKFCHIHRKGKQSAIKSFEKTESRNVNINCLYITRSDWKNINITKHYVFVWPVSVRHNYLTEEATSTATWCSIFIAPSIAVDSLSSKPFFTQLLGRGCNNWSRVIHQVSL